MIYVEAITGYDGTQSYEPRAKLLETAGFTRLRSAPDHEGNFLEVWLLAGTWQAKSPCATHTEDAIFEWVRTTIRPGRLAHVKDVWGLVFPCRKSMAMDHTTMIADGSSWIDIVGGPHDGQKKYFRLGPPPWMIHFCDPSVDPARYREGDVAHLYTLTQGREGEAIYLHQGSLSLRRQPESQEE